MTDTVNVRKVSRVLQVPIVPHLGSREQLSEMHPRTDGVFPALPRTPACPSLRRASFSGASDVLLEQP